jgi:hypothetical protein
MENNTECMLIYGPLELYFIKCFMEYIHLMDPQILKYGEKYRSEILNTHQVLKLVKMPKISLKDA